MRIYYAKSTGGFYNDDIHGARRVNVPDPRWERPTLEVPSPDWKPKGEQTEEDRPSVVVPDENALQPLVEIDNSACRIPTDAIEITAAEHRELLAGQERGMEIVGNAVGQPRLIPRVVTAEEIRARCVTLLAASDWISLRAVERGESLPTAWREYREQLRVIHSAAADGQDVRWPAPPEG